MLGLSGDVLALAGVQALAHVRLVGVAVGLDRRLVSADALEPIRHEEEIRSQHVGEQIPQRASRVLVPLGRHREVGRRQLQLEVGRRQGPQLLRPPGELAEAGDHAVPLVVVLPVDEAGAGAHLGQRVTEGRH